MIRAAREQCIALENETASLLRAGAVPAEIYEKILSLVDPAFREGFMNGCKFLGHSIGLTMDGSRQRLLGSARVRHDACR